MCIRDRDYEYTIEKGVLYCLQTRNGKMNAQAMVRSSVEMANEGLISREKALLRIDPESLEQMMFPQLDPKQKVAPASQGMGASPGAASGKIVFDADTAVKRGRGANEKIILVREETKPEDIHGFFAAVGILTLSLIHILDDVLGWRDGGLDRVTAQRQQQQAGRDGSFQHGNSSSQISMVPERFPSPETRSRNASGQGVLAGVGPPAAALVNIRPINFSKTKADWVNLRTLPFLRWSSMPPGSKPTYCSPNNPDVRMLALESVGRRSYFCLLYTSGGTG